MTRDLHAIAIGASSGGVEVLLQIAAALPPRFPAIVLVTLHVGSNHSILPELMRARGRNHAMHPLDGDRPLTGTIYVAPPDCHLLIEQDRIRLYRGPKENHARPAIDPMFRSAALSFRERAVGVVLTGQLDDGAAGLKAIKRCGGTAIVQDPATAMEPSMPVSALANVDVDLCLRVEEIVPALERIVTGRAPRASGAPSDEARREQQMMEGHDVMENLAAIAEPSTLTCPDCGGGLWELNDDRPLRYRCHTGHAFTAQSLAYAQKEGAEYGMWSGVRALQERAILHERMARIARAQGDAAQAEAGEREAKRARERAEALVRMIEHHADSA